MATAATTLIPSIANYSHEMCSRFFHDADDSFSESLAADCAGRLITAFISIVTPFLACHQPSAESRLAYADEVVSSAAMLAQAAACQVELRLGKRLAVGRREPRRLRRI